MNNILIYSTFSRENVYIYNICMTIYMYVFYIYMSLDPYIYIYYCVSPSQHTSLRQDCARVRVCVASMHGCE